MKIYNVPQVKKMLQEGWGFNLPGEYYQYAYRGYTIGPGLAEAIILANGKLTYKVIRISRQAEEFLRYATLQIIKE